MEDRVREELARRLRVVNGSYVGKFVAARLEEELKRFHNPTTEKTKKLIHDFLQVDVVSGWEWPNYDSAKAKRTLDELISKRGDAVHRSKPIATGAPCTPHLMKREDLEKAIRFLKCLVEATDKVLVEE